MKKPLYPAAYLVAKLKTVWGKEGKKGSELESYYFQYSTKESYKWYLEHIKLFSALEARNRIHRMNCLDFKKNQTCKTET